MPLDFVNILKNYFNDAFNKQVAKSLNESPVNIAKALSAIIPVGLNSILSIATSGKSGANHIFDMAKNAGESLPPSPDVKYLPAENATYSFVEEIFGGNQVEVLDSISNFAIIHDQSSSNLLELVISYALGFLGKHAEKNDLSASGLSGFLSSQHRNISNALPSELTFFRAINDSDSVSSPQIKGGNRSFKHVTKIIDNLAKDPQTNIADKPSFTRWLLPLILIIVVIALIWYFTTG